MDWTEYGSVFSPYAGKYINPFRDFFQNHLKLMVILIKYYVMLFLLSKIQRFQYIFTRFF